MSSLTDLNNSNVLKAKRRISYFLLSFLTILLIMAGFTFPFVDHATKLQNILYGLIVTAPFLIVNICFIVLTGKDLEETSK